MVGFSIERLRSATRNVPVDIFIKLGEGHFVHVFSKASGIDYKRLAQYIQRGTDELYVKPEDEPLLQAYLGRSTDDILSDLKSTKEEKVGAILNRTEQNLAEVFQLFPVSEATAKATEKVVKNYVEIMSSQPDTLALILRLAAHGNYLYFHTIAVSVFSMLIAKEMLELGDPRIDPETIELIGKGAFWHDIGLAAQSQTNSVIDEDLDPEHPRVGLSLLEATPGVSHEVKYIVYQHHEQPSSKGYPNKLNARAIYFPSQIVAVADAFSKRMSAAVHAKTPAKPEEILTELQAEAQKKGAFDLSAVKAARMVFLMDGAKKKKSTSEAA